MNVNDLFLSDGIDPRRVLVLRHRPQEPQLNKRLPWLAAERPDIFNAYQQTQKAKLEGTMEKMKGSGYVASFIRHKAGKALFVGLYAIKSSKRLTFEEFWKVPAYIEMKTLGIKEWFTKEECRDGVLWFDLALTDFYAQWKGRLIIGWPPPERSWWRRAHRNDFSILAVLEDSALTGQMPSWDAIDFTWQDFDILPMAWKAALAQWSGVYYIFDTSDGKAYVGSASGKEGLLGRWLNYATDGHGGNCLLRNRDPNHFRFSILERVSPDIVPSDLARLEASWKNRLHTRAPYGLNEN